MLLRNIDLKLGLCNGIRLIITRMEKFVLEGKVISRSNIGEKFSYPGYLFHCRMLKFLSNFEEDNFQYLFQLP